MPGGSAATAVVVARPRLAYRGSTPGDFLFHDAGPVGLARLPFSPTPPPPPSPSPPNAGRPSTAVVGASAGGTAAAAVAAQVAPAGREYGSF